MLLPLAGVGQKHIDEIGFDEVTLNLWGLIPVRNWARRLVLM